MRVCQFRHDGKWTSTAATGRHRIWKTCFFILQAKVPLSNDETGEKHALLSGTFYS